MSCLLTSSLLICPCHSFHPATSSWIKKITKNNNLLPCKSQCISKVHAGIIFCFRRHSVREKIIRIFVLVFRWKCFASLSAGPSTEYTNKLPSPDISGALVLCVTSDKPNKTLISAVISIRSPGESVLILSPSLGQPHHLPSGEV